MGVKRFNDNFQRTGLLICITNEFTTNVRLQKCASYDSALNLDVRTGNSETRTPKSNELSYFFRITRSFHKKRLLTNF